MERIQPTADTVHIKNRDKRIAKQLRLPLKIVWRETKIHEENYDD